MTDPPWTRPKQEAGSLLLHSAAYAVFLIAFVALVTLAFNSRARWMDRRWRAAEQEGHRRAKQHLVVVQRVVSRSWWGTRAVVLWTTTGTEQELWFAGAGLRPGDSLAIAASADPSTGRVDVKNILPRAYADSVAES